MLTIKLKLSYLRNKISNRYFVNKVMESANFINKTSRNGSGNFILIGSEISKIFKDI